MLVQQQTLSGMLAKELLVKETLDHTQLEKIFAKVKKLPERPVWKSHPKRPASTKGPIAMPAKASAEVKTPRARKPKSAE